MLILKRDHCPQLTDLNYFMLRQQPFEDLARSAINELLPNEREDQIIFTFAIAVYVLILYNLISRFGDL